MARILFGCVPFWGHINPTIAVAQKLIELGHTVAYACHSEMRGAFDKAGIPFVENYEFCDLFIKLNQMVSSHTMSDLRKELKKANEKLLYIPAAQLEPNVKDFVRLIDEWQPDVCVFDIFFLPGRLAAEIRGIPFVFSCCAMSLMLPSKDLLPVGYGFPSYRKRPDLHGAIKLLLSGWFANKLLRYINSIRARFSLQPQGHVGQEPGYLYLNYSTPALDFKRSDLPAQVYYLGPSISKDQYGSDTEFPWEWLDGRPLIYVTMGTFFTKKKIFDQVIAASKGASWQAVMSVTKHMDISQWQHIPDNVLIRNFVPQSKLMKKVSAVVCAGGSNTTTEALLLGIPLLVMPQATDHFDNAQRVVEAKAGFRLDPKELSVRKIRHAITRMLIDPSYRRHAREIAADYEKCDAPFAGAQLVLKLAERKRPLFRPAHIGPTIYKENIEDVLASI